MNTKKIDQLFREYEAAFDGLELDRIADRYADSFISAGPKGSIAQSKKDFFQKTKQAASFYRTLGQHSAKLLYKQIIPISNEYALVTTHWGVLYEKTGNKPVEFDVSYLVQQLNDELKIILFITHQDEGAEMKKLGLIKQVASH